MDIKSAKSRISCNLWNISVWIQTADVPGMSMKVGVVLIMSCTLFERLSNIECQQNLAMCFIYLETIYIYMMADNNDIIEWVTTACDIDIVLCSKSPAARNIQDLL